MFILCNHISGNSHEKVASMFFFMVSIIEVGNWHDGNSQKSEVRFQNTFSKYWEFQNQHFFQTDFDTLCNRDLDVINKVGLGKTLKTSIRFLFKHPIHLYFNADTYASLSDCLYYTFDFTEKMIMNCLTRDVYLLL